MFDPILFKKQFPIFDHVENASLTYLDNAATTQKASIVIDAIIDFYARINANANRSSHRLGRAATEKIISTRKKIAQFIHADSEQEIVFTAGATESLNIVANGLSEQLSADSEVILSFAEHHANLVPWQEVAKKTGTRLTFISPDFSSWKEALNKKTKVVSVTAASNSLGVITDLSIVKEIKAYNPDIIVVVDASQLIAHKQINVVELGCDFLLFSAHKMYGPSGVGVLYGKKDILKNMQPLNFGGEMISKVELQSSEYVSGPERFEAGTSPLSSIVGFGAAIDFLSSQNRREMEAYEKQLTIYLHEKLSDFCDAHPGFKLLTSGNNNIGVAALSSTQYALVDVAYWLDEHDIAVRVGDHCAQPLWKRMDVATAVLRVSLSAYNTFEDIDKLISTLDSFIEINNNCKKTDVNVDGLLSLNGWQQRYKKIVQWGKSYRASPGIRCDKNLVSGCEVDLWLEVKENNGRWEFLIDSDSSVVKGLSLLMISQVDKKTKAEIENFDFLSFFSLLGLNKYLSESRVNGLTNLLNRIRNSCY